jgi:hypothetical protein
MQRSMRALAVAAGIAVTASILHSPSPQFAAPAHAKKGKGVEVAAETFINAAPIATGVIRRLLINPQGEVDALLLADGTIAKFPPHMSKELVAAIRLNDTVSVRGFREAEGTIKAFVITNEATKQQLVEHPPFEMEALPKHMRFAALARLKVTGTVELALRGREGEVNGALLQDGTVVRFPPHVAFDFANLLQPGQTLAVEGLGAENAYGRGLEATAMGPTMEALRPVYGK